MEKQAIAIGYGVSGMGESVQSSTRAAGAACLGVAQGAQIRTLEGDLPVEYLCPGDRIVTRSGMRVLQAVTVQIAKRDVVRVAGDCLGQGRPQAALYVGAQTRLMMRGWRAQTLYGAAEMPVAAEKLCDGAVVQRVQGGSVRLYRLHFDTSETVFAEGVEISVEPLNVLQK